MKCKQCPKCEARWVQNEQGEWQHYWSTGAVGSEEDLAGLVCNKLGDDQCINPKKGCTTGDSWEKREDYARKQLAEETKPHPDEL